MKEDRNKKPPKRGPSDKKGPKSPPIDDDVDEHGNIIGLIDYSASESESDRVMTGSELKKRKSALKAREGIRRSLNGKNRRSTVSTDSTYEPKKTRKSKKVVESDTESEDSKPVRKGKKVVESEDSKPIRKSKKAVESDTEEEDDDYDEDEDEDDEDEDEDDDDEDEDDEDDYESEYEDDPGFKGISISFGGGGAESTRMIPKRHNMKKESSDVKQFVKLVTKPVEEDTIDDQIDQFKSLDSPKKKTLLDALEKRSDYVKKEQPLMFRLLQMKLVPETMAMVMARYNSLNTMDPSSGEYYKLRSWMEKLVSIPLGLYKDMPVSLESPGDACGIFMRKARACLDEAIYGQDDSKLQIMQFIASKISNPNASGLSLLLIGSPGIGKTSLIKNGIAKALEWPFQFISLGGDSDATTYTGHQFVYEGSHSGKIANCLAQAKSMSMVMMFDELDKISSTPKGEEVQNLLVHLTDPVQNMEFEDKYLSGIPLDMSRTMFVFSANDINKIDRILLDRMVVVNLSGYQSKDKIAIAEQFLLPNALREVNLSEKVAISRDILQHILDNYAKEEHGVRELKRCIEQVIQRVNMLRMFNVKELPFHIPGFNLPFVLKKEHVDLFLKKKDSLDKTPLGMYT